MSETYLRFFIYLNQLRKREYMEGVKNTICTQEFVYDFAVDGGAIGTKILSDKNGKSPIPTGAIIKDVFAKVLTACTSGGSATVSWGNDTVTAYSGTAIAVASLTANAVFNGATAGSLIWDDTNDAPIYLNVADATKGSVRLAIATATLLTGKIAIVVEYYLPAGA